MKKLIIALIFSLLPSMVFALPNGVWEQGNSNFGIAGSNRSTVHSWAIHEGKLFVGGTYITNTMSILYSSDGVTWTSSTGTIFGTGCRRLHSASDGYLYCITSASSPRITRSDTGEGAWTSIITLPSTLAYGRWCFEWLGYLYVSVKGDNNETGAVYRCLLSNGCGTSGNWASIYTMPTGIEMFSSMLVHGGAIYATTSNVPDADSGIYKSIDGTTFNKISTTDFNVAGYQLLHSLVFFNGAFYIGTHNSNNSPYRGAIYKSTDYGVTWTKMFDFPDYEQEAYRLSVVDDTLFIGLVSAYTQGKGGIFYATRDGINFIKIGDFVYGSSDYTGTQDISPPFNGYIHAASVTPEDIPGIPVKWPISARIPVIR